MTVHAYGEYSRDFWPVPFWAMDHRSWMQYVESLEGEERRVLALYPFRRAYDPPHDSGTALEFLREIGVDGGQVSADAIQSAFEGMTTFDQLERQGKVEWRVPRVDEEPADGFRMIPEWERMAGVLLNWPTFYPPLWETFRQMMAALDHVTTFLRVPEGYLGAATLAWLDAQGIELSTVCPIPGPLGDIWARDYSPIYGINTTSGEAVAHKFAFAAYGQDYREAYRYTVDVDDRFVWKEGFQVHRSPILLDGGNLLADGRGTYVLTRRVLGDNASVPNLYARLEHWLGADRLIILDEQPGDTLGHINHIKFISPRRVLVGVPDREGTALSRYLRDAQGIFETHGYDVVEIPIPTGLTQTMVGGAATAHGLYANSLLVNGRVLAATFGVEEHDAAALDVYRQALPDHEVIAIDASILANDGGAINCSSKEIPDVSQVQGH